MPSLVWRSADGREHRFALVSGLRTIGRSSENDVVIAHPSLSRRHARLEVGPAGVTVTDLGGRNGTLVGGIQVRQCRLKHGDVMELGEVALAYLDDEPRPALTAALRLEGELRDLVGAAREHRPEASGPEARLRILLTVSQILSSPEPVERLLPKIVDLLFQVLAVDRVALLLAEPGEPELVPRITRSRRAGEAVDSFYSRSIVRHVFERGEGVLSDDAQSDERFAASATVAAAAIRSSMACPLRSREETLGVLYVDHRSVAEQYGPEDLEFLSGFARQAATAIENARLYARLEQEATRRSTLLRFFPPAVVGPLMEAPDFGREVRDAEVTVLFSDITGFTEMSSRLRPREVVALLNGYFPVMAEIVFRHQGTLEKYIGDALMAIWGAPVAHPDDADRALLAALEMREALARLNERAAPGQAFQIHVGLHTGPVAFGNIGSADYVQFAAIGDTTNVASRVCSAAGSGEVLISEATRARLRGGSFELHALPPVQVKGKAQPLHLHRASRRIGEETQPVPRSSLGL